MSGDDWEIFREARRQRRERRQRTLGEAEERKLEIHTLCARLRLWMVCSVDTHWRFGHLGREKTRLSYWPSSRKMQRHPSTRVSHSVSIDMLKEELERMAQVT